MVGMNPLEFLEEVQREYMVSSFGKVLNYDEMYSANGFFEFLQQEYNFMYEDKGELLK